MARTKKLVTTIESNVTFLTRPAVEFVSLVKRAANRTPFKILKSEDKGGDMSQIVQAVLIPKSLEEGDVKKHLDGFRDDEVAEYDTYMSYIQVPREEIADDSLEVVRLDKGDGVFGVVGTLKAEKDSKPQLKSVEKESVDYATMDDLYMELYAMADIVSGAMRQSNIKAKDRAKVILTAIDNFKTFAEALLSNLKEDVSPVKLEDHPRLIYPLLQLEPTAEPEPVNTEPEPAKDDEPDLNAVLGEFKETILSEVKSQIAALAEELQGQFATQTETVEALKTEIEGLKKTPKTSRSVKDDSIDDASEHFQGAIFRNS